jgi:hypothetical protein
MPNVGPVDPEHLAWLVERRWQGWVARSNAPGHVWAEDGLQDALELVLRGVVLAPADATAKQIEDLVLLTARACSRKYGRRWHVVPGKPRVTLAHLETARVVQGAVDHALHRPEWLWWFLQGQPIEQIGPEAFPSVRPDAARKRVRRALQRTLGELARVLQPLAVEQQRRRWFSAQSRFVTRVQALIKTTLSET